MREERVTFVSPGTFFSEETCKTIARRDPAAAVRMAAGVTERHGAKPFAFYFSTLITAEPVPDGEGGTLDVVPKEVDRSGRYFLGGTLVTLDELRRRADPKDRILVGNMESNDWPVVVVNTNSHRAVQPFEEGDVVVDESGAIVRRGDEPELVRYRAEKVAEHRAKMEMLYGRPA